MSVKKKRTIGPCRGVTWLHRCRHGISSLPFISILAFVTSFSSMIHDSDSFIGHRGVCSCLFCIMSAPVMHHALWPISFQNAKIFYSFDTAGQRFTCTAT